MIVNKVRAVVGRWAGGERERYAAEAPSLLRDAQHAMMRHDSVVPAQGLEEVLRIRQRRRNPTSSREASANVTGRLGYGTVD
jgi:hypothetical protein